MIRAVIIDDEPATRVALSALLREHCPDVTIAREAGSVEEGFRIISEVRPDLVFLDIRMQDGSGFDLLKKFDKVDFHVIFVTAYEEYAIKAFRFSAIDYLLKPVDADELISAMAKFRQQAHAERDLRVKTMINNLRFQEKHHKKIVLRTSEKFHFVEVTDIIYCESDGNYTTFFLRNHNQVIVSRPLKEFEELLSDYAFFRPHKSFLVNLSYLTGFEKSEGGYIILKDDVKIPVSYRKKDEFLKIVEGL